MSSISITNDPCSFSNPQDFVLKNLALDWDIDFNEKIFKGHAHLKFNVHNSKADSIVLDTRDLNIESIVETVSQTPLSFELGTYSVNFGTPLNISLSNLTLSEHLSLTVTYKTSPNASALQWLDANCTMGKQHPYLFSQCQAIHARSIFPCQDTPQVKFTYEAKVRVQKPLTVLMSAIHKHTHHVSESVNEFSFEQNIPIPSYLLAIASGDLVSRELGPISRVWTEKEMIERAAYEFTGVDQMLKDAEELMGKYVWGRYDLLVLPPTFPYGGMENPTLTFVTPTIIAGDRSLVTVIQHEIAHSWTGNLVTNASWEHFWLNEGFTRFVERKLIGMFEKSEQCRQFECFEGWRDLGETVNVVFGKDSPLTRLCPCLRETDPDDAFSSIPYEKGHMLLYHLEELLGGVEVFNKYLRAHIDRFSGKAINSDEWKAFLYEYFSDKKDILDQVDWENWLYTPGMPPVNLKFDEFLVGLVRELADNLYNEPTLTLADPVFEKFTSSQKRELLSQLLDRDPLSADKMTSLNELYKFGETQNSEILFRWLRLGLKAKWEPIIEPALKFVRDQGRMKFTRPVYKDLYAWEAVRVRAIENFQQQRPFMHQTTAGLVAKDLNLC